MSVVNALSQTIAGDTSSFREWTYRDIMTNTERQVGYIEVKRKKQEQTGSLTRRHYLTLNHISLGNRLSFLIMRRLQGNRVPQPTKLNPYIYVNLPP